MEQPCSGTTAAGLRVHDYADLRVVPTVGERCCRPGRLPSWGRHSDIAVIIVFVEALSLQNGGPTCRRPSAEKPLYPSRHRRRLKGCAWCPSTTPRTRTETERVK